MKLLCGLLIGCVALHSQVPGWFSDKEYENVSVRFEYKLAQWAETAFVLRTPKIGRPIQQGVAVFLAHDFHQKTSLYVTGAIAGKQAPLQLLKPSFGQWHRLEIRLEGDEIEVSQDGQLLQLARLGPELRGRGYLHFAKLEHNYEIRNFQLKDLGSAQKYIEDWRPFTLRAAPRQGGEWTLGANSARGANGHSIQYASPKLKDFVLSAEVKSSNRANGGIFLRGDAQADKPRGFEVQIYSPLDAVYPTGSIYGQVRSHLAAEVEERWFHLRILLSGKRCVVWVDGVEVASSDDIQELEGQIGLQIHMENTAVEWRNLRAWTLEAGSI